MFGEPPEVLVSGAGPVGQFAALALAKRGIRVRIIDTGIWACTHSYALALHPRSMALLDRLGLAGRVRDRAHAVKSIGLYDAGLRKAQIPLASPMLVLGQDALEEVFEKALKDLGVAIEWRHELFSLEQRGDHVAARVDKFEKESRGYVVAHTEWVLAKSENLEVPFVIGADGYNSKVRKAAGIEFEETGPAQYYAVFEFRSNFELGNEMRVVLGDDTTDVLWPLPNGYCRWSFQLPGYAAPDAERLKDRMLAPGLGPSPVLDESNLRTFISQRAPWFRGSIEGFSFRILARFEKRLAQRLGAGRMWLAGDAAHLTGPVGVQSMNLGLEESAELAEILQRALTHTGAAESDLEAYNQRWTRTWRQLQGIQGGLLPKSGSDAWIAHHAGRLLSCLPAHGEELAAMAGQLGMQLS